MGGCKGHPKQYSKTVSHFVSNYTVKTSILAKLCSFFKAFGPKALKNSDENRIINLITGGQLSYPLSEKQY